MTVAKAPAIPVLFRAALKRAGLPLPVPEYRFDGRDWDDTAKPKIPRAWRFDFAWPFMETDRRRGVVGSTSFEWVTDKPVRVAVEQEGGIWIQGRHTRGSGFVKDMDKYNEAAAQGWRILRVEPKRLHHPDTIDLIRRALAA